MDTTANPTPAPEHADDHGGEAVRNASTVIELLGILTLGITLVLDAVSRLVNEDKSTWAHVATGFAVAAGLCAVLDAIATASAYRRHPHAFRVHLMADVTAAVLILVSVGLRLNYWSTTEATPLRATVPAAIAFVLILVATWTNITERSTEARSGTHPA